jgi:hypothetical protein
MEVLQIQRSRESCCLVLVFGRSSSPVLPRVGALLDYVRTTASGLAAPPSATAQNVARLSRWTIRYSGFSLLTTVS